MNLKKHRQNLKPNMAAKIPKVAAPWEQPKKIVLSSDPRKYMKQSLKKSWPNPYLPALIHI